MEATRLLRQDHYRLKELLNQYDALPESDARRQHLFEIISTELDMHARLEEEIFYPAARAARVSESAIAQGLEEHRTIRALMRDLARLSPSSEEFETTMSSLRQHVLEHVDQEEDSGGGMFAQAREHLPKDQLLELGMRMEARREALTCDWIGAASAWLTRLAPGGL